MSSNFSLNCIILILLCQGIFAQLDGYEYSPGIGWHKFHTMALSWNNARKICIQEGGHLAIIDSSNEAMVLQQLFNKSGPITEYTMYPNIAFLGMHDLYAEGDWVTVLDEPFSLVGYSEWSKLYGGQPDNGGGTQHCGGLIKDDGLDDIWCTESFPFFCELSEKSEYENRV